MAHIDQVTPDDATGVLKKIYDAAMGRYGSVSNIVKLMSLDERLAQASIQFYVSLMNRENALSASRREMLATVVSNVNGCYY